MIDVILREDVSDLGKAGALVRVKPGYARNYLLPRGLAYPATEGNRKRIAAEQQARAARLAAERGGAEGLAAALAGLELVLTAKAGEEGRLFGSVTAQDIADALAARGHAINKRQIGIEHPIKHLGTHSVAVRLHPEVTADIQVTVNPD
jgi:large subunit ribosomal protein L9